MKLNEDIIDFSLAVFLLAATCTVLFIGGLSMSPASAAVKRSDVSSVTHSSVPVGTQSIGKTSSANYSRFDLNSVTNN